MVCTYINFKTETYCNLSELKDNLLEIDYSTTNSLELKLANNYKY